MSLRRLEAALSLLLWISAFALVAAHVWFMHEGTLLSDTCPLCRWGQSLCLGQTFVLVLIGVCPAGQVLLEPVETFLATPVRHPFSARAPPARTG